MLEKKKKDCERIEGRRKVKKKKKRKISLDEKSNNNFFREYLYHAREKKLWTNRNEEKTEKK